MAIRLEAKRPDETINYVINWVDYLGDDTIATSAIVAEGVTATSSNDDTTVTLTLSGGTAGLANVRNTITTAGGLTETEVLTIYVSDFAEPVSLATAKAHLRITDDSEDTLIGHYIRAAREWIENYTGHILVRRPVTQMFDRFSPYLELHKRPVASVEEIAYTDTDGIAQTVADYAQTTGRYPFRLYPDELPSIQTYSTITVTFTAGYAEGEEPQALVQAMLLLIGHWFTTRAGVTEEARHEVPLAVYSLCAMHRASVV